MRKPARAHVDPDGAHLVHRDGGRVGFAQKREMVKGFALVLSVDGKPDKPLVQVKDDADHVAHLDPHAVGRRLGRHVPHGPRAVKRKRHLCHVVSGPRPAFGIKVDPLGRPPDLDHALCQDGRLVVVPAARDKHVGRDGLHRDGRDRDERDAVAQDTDQLCPHPVGVGCKPHPPLGGALPLPARVHAPVFALERTKHARSGVDESVNHDGHVRVALGLGPGGPVPPAEGHDGWVLPCHAEEPGHDVGGSLAVGLAPCFQRAPGLDRGPIHAQPVQRHFHQDHGVLHQERLDVHQDAELGGKRGAGLVLSPRQRVWGDRPHSDRGVKHHAHNLHQTDQHVGRQPPLLVLVLVLDLSLLGLSLVQLGHDVVHGADGQNKADAERGHGRVGG